ncbi:hypothetical protein [Nocardiopsis changdeensis]|uniref:hypothetical protein n=1 Tax=Nocardiopsis changdeensis TaxID=2831969 RepID=UPI003F4897CC
MARATVAAADGAARCAPGTALNVLCGTCAGPARDLAAADTSGDFTTGTRAWLDGLIGRGRYTEDVWAG